MIGTDLEFDTVLELCCDQRRRIVLATLAEEQRSLTLNDLTKRVRASTYQTPVTEVSKEVLTEIRLSLHHQHIPKLASAGVVEYDQDRHLVKPAKHFDNLQPDLSTIIDADPNLAAPIEL